MQANMSTPRLSQPTPAAATFPSNFRTLPPLPFSIFRPKWRPNTCSSLHRSGRGRFSSFHSARRRYDSYGTRKKGFWEDPDDGMESGSDGDEEEEEESDLDFESDWEGEVGDRPSTVALSVATYSTGSDEQELQAEVDQLLEPEERAILLENAAPNLDKISTTKWSALHTLSLAGQIPYMDQLLENGLDIETTDKDGLTALHKAIIGKKEAVVSHLLRKGASPHARDKGGATPLHYAVQVGAMQTVKLLIKCKADVNIADNEGWTPLHVAIQSRNRDIAKVLLVNGADKTRRNVDGKMPLDISLCYGKDFKSYQLAQLLKVLPVNQDF